MSLFRALGAGLAFWGLFSVPPSACAQTTPDAGTAIVVPPPPGQPVPALPGQPTVFGQSTATTISAPAVADGVVSPLVDQAEIDLGEGAAHVALARLLAAKQLVDPTGPLATRIESLAALATARVAAAPVAPPVAPEVIYAPLVSAAEADVSASRQPLALARLELALRSIPPPSALLDRARSLWQLVSAGTSAYGDQTGLAQPTPPTPLLPPSTAPASDPNAATQAEMLELYTMVGTWSVYTGGWALSLAGSKDPALYGTVPILAGLGGVLGVYGLDRTVGFRRGQPSSISVGLEAGTIAGVLWSIGLGATGQGVNGALSTVWIGATLGGGLGAVLAYTLEPSLGQSRWVQSVALMGLLMAASIGMMADVHGDRDYGRYMLVGYSAALLGAALAAPAIRLSAAQMFGVDASVFGGALLALGLTAAIERNGTSTRVAGIALASGEVAGLLLAILIESGGSASSSGPAASGAVPQVYATPLPGGGVLGGFGGRF